MNKIDITKIAVKFDSDTTEEQYHGCINKFVELGYSGQTLTRGSYAHKDDYSYLLLVDLKERISMWQVTSLYLNLKNYTIMSPEEFLALGTTPADNNEAAIEWLNKLQYVFDRDITLDFATSASGIYLPTDFGDIRGAETIVKFINRRYEEISNEENTKKKAELEAKRQKLMDELSEIDQQLGLYK